MYLCIKQNGSGEGVTMTGIDQWFDPFNTPAERERFRTLYEDQLAAAKALIGITQIGITCSEHDTFPPEWSPVPPTNFKWFRLH